MDGDGGAYNRYMDMQALDAEVAGIKEPDPMTQEERLQNVDKWFEKMAKYEREQEEQAFVDWFMGREAVITGHRRAG